MGFFLAIAINLRGKIAGISYLQKKLHFQYDIHFNIKMYKKSEYLKLFFGSTQM